MAIGEFVDGMYIHPVTQAALVNQSISEQKGMGLLSGVAMMRTCLSTRMFVDAIGTRGLGLPEPQKSDFRSAMKSLVMEAHGVDDELTAAFAVGSMEEAIMHARRDERNTRVLSALRGIVTLGFKS